MKKIILVVMMIPLCAFAGHDQGGSDLIQTPMPSEPFQYDCLAEISATPPPPYKEGAIIYQEQSRQTFSLNNEFVFTWGGMGISLPQKSWVNGRRAFPTPENHDPQFEVLAGEPSYPLDGHFYDFGFSQTKDGWNVELRANLVFKELHTGVAAFALGDFKSKEIGVRLSMRNPTPAKGGIDLSINCQRVK